MKKRFYTFVMQKDCFIAVLAAMFLSSCAGTTKTSTGAIVNDEMENLHKGSVSLSSLVDVENIIPLETTDVSLLGEISKIQKKEDLIYVSSRNRPLSLFDKQGRFVGQIGSIGVGPEEYVQLIDFDVDRDFVYLLTNQKIQVYEKDGEWVKSIPLELNASGICVTESNLFLFVLGDKYVVHILDKAGHAGQQVQESNQALRLNRAMPFIECGDSVLFPLGRSNDILVFDTSKSNASSYVNYLSSNQLSNEEEARMMEESSQYQRLMQQMGCFDGLMADNTHIIFPYIKGNGIQIWVKGIQDGSCTAYMLAQMENDITFAPTANFFYGNTVDDVGFLTYIMPYRLRECMSEAGDRADSPYFAKMREVLGQVDEESNPILIEYKVK